MVWSNNVAAILVMLPHDLFYNVLVDWIDQAVLITFVVLDAALRDNNLLRTTLQTHLLFIKSNTRDHVTNFYFDQSRNCYRSTVLTRIPKIFSKLSKEVLLDTDLLDYNYIKPLEDSDDFLSCCRSIVSLRTNNGCIVEKLSPTTLNGLQEARFEKCIIKTLKVYELMIAHCRNLRVLAISSCNKLNNDIVRNNPHLTDIDITTSSEVFNVILESCPNLINVNLRICHGMMKLMQVARLCVGLHTLKSCTVEHAVEVLQRSEDNVSVACLLDNFATPDLYRFMECMKTRQVWKFLYLTDTPMLDGISKFCSKHILELECRDLLSTALVAMMNVFKTCLLLQKVELIFSNWNNVDIVELFTYAPHTLVDVNIVADNLKMSSIVTILQLCPQLINCAFYRVIDDTVTDATVVPALRQVIEESRNTLINICISFRQGRTCILSVDQLLLAFT